MGGSYPVWRWSNENYIQSAGLSDRLPRSDAGPDQKNFGYNAQGEVVQGRRAEISTFMIIQKKETSDLMF
jgi:hypothetical protein